MDKYELYSAFMNEDFDQLIKKITIFLNNPIVVINNANRIVAATNDSSIEDVTWQNAVSRGYITLEFGTALNHFEQLRKPNQSYIEVDQIDQHKRRFYKLTHQNKLYGYLNIMDYYHPLEDLLESDYATVVEILSKELSINKDFHANILESILFDLIDQQFLDRTGFTETIKDTYFEIPRSYNVIYADFSNQLSFNADRDTYREQIYAFFPHSVFALRNNKLRILIPSGECIIKQELLHMLNTHSLFLGISDSFTDLFAYKEYERQARAALRYQDLRFTKKPYISYDEIKSYDLISKTKNIDSFINTEILKIHQYDEENHSDYVRTLYAYLSLSQSIIATSEYLFLHRNTVNYRIKTIKELFHLHLDNPDLINEYLFSLKVILAKNQKNT